MQLKLKVGEVNHKINLLEKYHLLCCQFSPMNAKIFIRCHTIFLDFFITILHTLNSIYIIKNSAVIIIVIAKTVKTTRDKSVKVTKILFVIYCASNFQNILNLIKLDPEKFNNLTYLSMQSF